MCRCFVLPLLLWLNTLFIFRVLLSSSRRHGSLSAFFYWYTQKNLFLFFFCFCFHFEWSGKIFCVFNLCLCVLRSYAAGNWNWTTENWNAKMCVSLVTNFGRHEHINEYVHGHDNKICCFWGWRENFWNWRYFDLVTEWFWDWIFIFNGQ